jgi:hypothetical protein
MRRPVIAPIALAATAALAGPSAADPLKPIDATPMLSKLEVFRDDLGNIYVVPKPDAVSFDEAQAWVFYGDRKTLYQQRVIGAGKNGNTEFEFDLWAPRARDQRVAAMQVEGGKLALHCRPGKDGTRPLTQLQADEASTLLRHAKFMPPLWIHQAHLLARDDDGVYYYVDAVREEYGGKGYRVFVGPKGRMKQVVMTNIVSDSAGEIYVTKTGQLKLIAGTAKMYWIKDGKKNELTALPPENNIYLIYRDLGIYGRLGAVCDDL